MLRNTLAGSKTVVSISRIDPVYIVYNTVYDIICNIVHDIPPSSRSGAATCGGGIRADIPKRGAVRLARRPCARAPYCCTQHVPLNARAPYCCTQRAPLNAHKPFCCTQHAPLNARAPYCLELASILLGSAS